MTARMKFVGLSILVLFLQTENAVAQQPLPPSYASGVGLNYVRSWQVVAPDTSATAIVTRPLKDVRMTTQYLDGLARPLQTVTKLGSLETGGSSADLVAANVYDDYGREVYKYLPFAANTTAGNASLTDGGFKANPFQQQEVFMQGMYSSQGETYYYGKTEFENSPMQRVTRAMSPGNNWVGANRGIRKEYYYNQSTETTLRRWVVADAIGSIPTSPAAYGAGQLSKVATYDENNNLVYEYTDKKGKLVIKSMQVGSEWAMTTYIYDDFGFLRCVIPPKANAAIASNWTLTQAIMDELCFRYEYDQRGRVVVKKVPGADEMRMVYDARDRVVLSQDGNLRQKKQWLFTSYDEANRPVTTGILNDATNFNNRAYHQGLADASTSYPNLSGYTYEVLTRNFYDNYVWISNYLVPFSTTRVTTDDAKFLTPSTTYPYPQALTQSDNIYGKPTGMAVKVLGTSQFLYTVNFYDADGRVIQTISQNLTGGTVTSTTQYSYSGQPLVNYSVVKYNTSSATAGTLTKYDYDDLGRVLTIKKTALNSAGITSGEKTIVQNEYDKLGQLKKKKLAPAYKSTGLESLLYDYNIRGWMLGMNRDYLRDQGGVGYQDKYFGFELRYDKDFAMSGNTAGAPNQFNGNISGSSWKTKGDMVRRKFDYEYDQLNRLLKANYTQNSTAASGGSWTKTEMDYSVHGFDADNNWGIKYDLNGNILQMISHGFKLGDPTGYIDALRYTYNTNSNKLKYVGDDYSDPNTKLGDFKDGTNAPGTDDYAYDVNGNMKIDNNKSIDSIQYNHLNLPAFVHIKGKGNITYTYDAAGNKLKKTVLDSTAAQKVTTTVYVGGQVYENDALQFMGHEEGRVRYKAAVGSTPASFQYDYFLKDHLGNVRMVLTEESQQDVYPALTFEGTWTDTTTAVAIEKLYYNVDSSKIVNASVATGITAYQNNNGNPPFNNNPKSNTTANSAKVYQMNGSVNKTGLTIALKVMAGDTINIYGKSYYNLNGGTISGTTTAPTTLALLTSFAGTNAISSKGVSGTALNSITQLTSGITSLLGTQPAQTSSTPKAFINWILFDERFNYAGGGYDRVGSSGTVKNHNSSTIPSIVVPKNGYIYVYCSNESNINVFFDNLQIIHSRGPIVEETHYYPFGLIMAGASAKTINAAGYDLSCGCGNKRGFNGNEKQENEFIDGSGLNVYDFNARTYDQQIGRFIQIDPIPEEGDQESLSPYHFAGNNPVLYNDPDGKCPWCLVYVVKFLVGAAVEYGSQVYDNYKEGKTGADVLIPQSTGKIILNGVTSAFDPSGGAVKKAVLKTVSNVVESVGGQLLEGKKVELGKTVKDVAVMTLSSVVKVDGSKTVASAEKNAAKLERVAKNSPSARNKIQAAQAKDAAKVADLKNQGLETATTETTESIAGKKADKIDFSAGYGVNNFDFRGLGVDNTSVKKPTFRPVRPLYSQ
ncbi:MULTISPECIES: DUF6443 domain-containing protein [unclassified Paraflavitalea]|uniref:DUF6443 domain-containing protein n=1 Tax=unclassified Paraflavitalea TaxID=2798305 RepID=UPI003D33CCF2